jgi:RNA polymerase sigma-70 factor, ECF subfamily
MTDDRVYLDGQINTITSSLLNVARRGDQQAWERLVHVYLPLVYRWCQRRRLQDADMRDVAQEVMRNVWKDLPNFERDRTGGTFRGWLRRITDHAICDHFRRAAKQPAGQGGSEAERRLQDSPAPDPNDGEASLGEDRQLLYSRVVEFVRGEFSENDWQAFYLVTVENRPAAEVAQTLGVSRNKVYLAKSRVLKRVWEELGDGSGDAVGSGIPKN